MEHKGLEPEIDKFKNLDKYSTNTENNEPYSANNKTLTTKHKNDKIENYGQIKDTEKHVIDKLRAQYEHNKIPSDLTKLINAWSNIPENVTRGIIAMVDCYIE